MNLHNTIMNIPTEIDFTDWSDHDRQSYKRGHRDARHAGAELSLKAEARIDELEDTLLESIGAMLGGNLTRESDMGKSILDALEQKSNND
jgi:hypothetical protein